MDRKTLAKLPESPTPTPIYAKLIYGENQSWDFLVMPDQFRQRTASNYQASGALGVRQNQIYQSSTEELFIPSLNLSTEGTGKHLSDYLDALKDLVNPLPGRFSPPVLSFRWGDTFFRPCVLTSCEVLQRNWLPNSLVTNATVSISLLKVPRDQIVDI